MADNPDTGAWSRYPTMSPPAESESPADPKFANMYPSMPNGAVPDRRVPRHPTMSEAGSAIRPTEPDPKLGPAAEGEAASVQPRPSAESGQPEPEPPAPAEMPEAYRNLRLPEGYEMGENFAPIARELAEAGFTKAQAEKAVELYARLEGETDRHLESTARAWRAEAERLPPAVLDDARGALKDAPAELKRVIEASRVGDNPKVIEFFARLRTGAGTPAEDPFARRYPNTKWS